MEGAPSEFRALPLPDQERYAKAWTAYFQPFMWWLVMTIAAGFLWIIDHRLTVGVELLAIIVLVVNVLAVRAVVLWHDSFGVWVFSGILPWTKGVSGVKWRDVEDAVFFRSFGSWLTGAYTIRVRHRFTRSSEILLSGIRRGEVAAEQINNHLRHILATSPRP